MQALTVSARTLAEILQASPSALRGTLLMFGNLFELLAFLWLIAGPISLFLLWRKLAEVEDRERSIRQEIAKVRRELATSRTEAAGATGTAAAVGTAGGSAPAKKPQPVHSSQTSTAALTSESSIAETPPLRPVAESLAGRGNTANDLAAAFREFDESSSTSTASSSSSAAASAPAGSASAASAAKTTANTGAEDRAAARELVGRLKERADAAISLEEILAGRWLTWVGAVALMIGAGFFFRYSIEQDLISESGRVGLGILTGVLGFAAGCLLMRKDYRLLAQRVTAASAGTVYFALYFAAQQYQLLPIPLAFAGMVAVTASLLTFAGIFNGQPTAVLGLIGGFLTPLMLSRGGGNPWVLFGYLLVLDSGVLMLATWRNWGGARVVAFLGTVLIWTGWLAGSYSPGELIPIVAMMTLFYVLFAAMGVWHNLYRLRQPNRADYFLMLATPLVYFAGLYLLTWDELSHLHGLLAILLAVLYGGLAVFARLRHAAGRSIVLAFGGTGALFATLAIPLQLTGHWIALAWAAEALLLLELGLRFHERDLRKAGFALLIVVQLILAVYVAQTLDSPRQTVMDYPRLPGRAVVEAGSPASAGWLRVFNGRSFSLLASAIVLGVLSWEYRRLDSTPGINIHGTGTSSLLPRNSAAAAMAGTEGERSLSTSEPPADAWLFPPAKVAGVLLAGVPLTVVILLLLETLSLGVARNWLTATTHSVSLMWVVLTAVSLILLSLWPGPRWLGLVGTGLFAVAALMLMSLAGSTFNSWDRQLMGLSASSGATGIWSLPLFNPRGLSLLLMAVACGGAAALSRRLAPPPVPLNEPRGERYFSTDALPWWQNPAWQMLYPGHQSFTVVLGLAAVMTGLVLFTVETWAYGAVAGWSPGTRALAVTLVWALYGTAMLLIGIARRLKTIRVLALSVFVLTAFKVFLYDVWRVHPAVRTLAFVALGASLMLVSFLYRRYQSRIRDFFIDSSNTPPSIE
ncbi:MAG: DUF2339 domain-containing protein [Planctomycetaceae bacterium]|nr:DUF2339 domain-containing protein [Planctomycetaceae bacterium]